MSTMSKQAREEFLAATHIAVLSVAGDQGRPPMSAPTFYGYTPGGDITVFTATQRRTPLKLRHIRERGVVTLVVQREEPPYAYVTVEGSVLDIVSPPAESQMLAILERYMPTEHAHGFTRSELDDPETKLTLITIRPDRWLTSDTSQ